MHVEADRSFLISAVIATYNVARYLPPLLQSIEEQTYGSRNVQFVFVDDGSTDDSLAILQEWAKGREDHVVVLTQPNAWVAEARNAGLAVATGEWVTFTDPDDVLDLGYFAEAAKFISLYGRIDHLSLIAAHQMRLLPSGEIRDTHPHRRKFTRGSRTVDLHVEPVFQLSVNSAFFRRATIEEHQIRFDGRVRPNFEDGHFIATYLLKSHTHHLGLMASAKYLYRTREDDTSLLTSSFTEAGKYTNVLRYGYLDLLRTAAAMGRVPRWLENTVLYELFWIYKAQLAIHSMSASAPKHVFEEFHGLARQILDFIAPDAIRHFDFIGVEHPIRLALEFGYNQTNFRAGHARYTDVDTPQHLLRIEYWFSGRLPDEEFVVDDKLAMPRYATVQDFDFYGRTLIRKRTLWLPRGERTFVKTDGVVRPIDRWEDQPAPEGLSGEKVAALERGKLRGIRARFNPSDQTYRSYVRGSISAWWSKVRPRKTKIYDWALATSLRLPSVRRKFAHAWALMDKNDQANDNAEHFYRWLAKHQPETNPWFILERSSESWGRLKAEGFKLVEYGSWQWKQLLLSADHFASSHADYYVTHPIDRRRYGNPRYRFTFLQHGVTQDDLSRWLNTKPFDLFITATPAETESIVGHGRYKFSDKEVVLTGFPRHDALLEKRSSVKPEGRNLLVVIPTWRQYLIGERTSNANQRDRIDDFLSSEYAQRYTALLNDPELLSAASAAGATVAFMPHPHMRPYLKDFAVPAGVRVLDFAVDDVQDVVAHAAMVLTDYSSMAFEAAFVDVPVVYYQFDKAEFWGGKNPRRQGYFDYERDGFGPVTYTHEAVIAAVAGVAANGFETSTVYSDRAAAAFVTRVGSSSQRVFEAMTFIQTGKRPVHEMATEASSATV